MSNIGRTIGRNIEKIKERLGVTNEDIGEVLGVTRQTVGKYIAGEQIIDSAKLFKLASFCNVPLKYFLQDSEASLSFMFRADNPKDTFDQSKALLINRKLISYCDLLKAANEADSVYIPESYRITVSGKTLSEDQRDKIKEIADKQRRALGLEDEIDIYRILEDHGINVYAMSLDISLDALSAYSEEYGAFILINDRQDIPEERKRFSCAHELGHLIFHREDYKSSTEELSYTNSRRDLREHMANLFASHLLIPRAILMKEFKRVMGKRKFVELSDIMILKKRFGVSAQALILALKEERLINDPTYGRYNKILRERYGNTEPEPMEPIKKNTKLFVILRNLAKDGEITTNKVAELLDISNLESRALVKAWAEPELI